MYTKLRLLCLGLAQLFAELSLGAVLLLLTLHWLDRATLGQRWPVEASYALGLACYAGSVVAGRLAVRLSLRSVAISLWLLDVLLQPVPLFGPSPERTAVPQ